MRAVTLTSKGAHPPSSCFTVNPAYPKPSLPSSDWVLARVRAIGINRTDLRQRNNEPANPVSFGMFINEFHNEKPAIIGEEFVGEVELAGDNTHFKPGDRVIGVYYGGGKAYDGCYAEYTLVHNNVCRSLPSADELTIGNAQGEVSWTALASFPGSAWTAWASLFQSASTTPGSTVLIRGATSSVGVWAIVLAKARGCTVIASTRQESKTAQLNALGADHTVIERSKDGQPDYESMVADVLAITPNGAQTVLDLVDPSSFASFGFKVCANYGTLVPTGILGGSYKPVPFSPFMIPSTKKLAFHGGFAVTDQLEECFRDIALGLLDGKYDAKKIVAMEVPLEEVGRAHDALEANQLVGKVVVSVS